MERGYKSAQIDDLVGKLEFLITKDGLLTLGKPIIVFSVLYITSLQCISYYNKQFSFPCTLTFCSFFILLKRCRCIHFTSSPLLTDWSCTSLHYYSILCLFLHYFIVFQLVLLFYVIEILCCIVGAAGT